MCSASIRTGSATDLTRITKRNVVEPETIRLHAEIEPVQIVTLRRNRKLLGTSALQHLSNVRVGEISPAELRAQARHFRTLASAIADEATRQALLAMAGGLENQAGAVAAAEQPQQPYSPPIANL